MDCLTSRIPYNIQAKNVRSTFPRTFSQVQDMPVQNTKIKELMSQILIKMLENLNSG